MAPDAGPVDIACLCAAWCRTCDEYRPVVEAVQAEFARDGVALRWHWIDIEDEADLLDDVDVETFPTLIVLDPSAVRFFGPLTPLPDTLRRLIRATVVEAAVGQRWSTIEPAIMALAARLRLRSARP